jgi:large subunit ribosomal protein L17
MQKSRRKRFRFGKDANKMLEKKLLRNFIIHGKLVSTEQKIKYIKPIIDRIISHAKKNTRSSINEITKKISDKKVIKIIFDSVVPAFEHRKSGFVKYQRLFNRMSDGSIMAKMEWVEPVVVEVKKVEEKVEKEKDNKKTLKKKKK